MESAYVNLAREFMLTLPAAGSGEPIQVRAEAMDDEAMARLKELAAAGTISLRPAPESDVQGHDVASDTVIVLVGDDVEGHALALRFPSAKDAQEFQRRLLATGVIAGALVIGAVGVNLADSGQAVSGSATGGAAQTIVQPRGVTDDVGLMDASGAAISQAAQVAEPRSSTDDVGIMDASGAAISSATQVAEPRAADDDVGLMDASGAAAGVVQSSDRAADDDVGLMDASGAAVADDDQPNPPPGNFRGR